MGRTSEYNKLKSEANLYDAKISIEKIRADLLKKINNAYEDLKTNLSKNSNTSVSSYNTEITAFWLDIEDSAVIDLLQENFSGTENENVRTFKSAESNYSNILKDATAEAQRLELDKKSADINNMEIEEGLNGSNDELPSDSIYSVQMVSQSDGSYNQNNQVYIIVNPVNDFQTSQHFVSTVNSKSSTGQENLIIKWGLPTLNGCINEFQKIDSNNIQALDNNRIQNQFNGQTFPVDSLQYNKPESHSNKGFKLPDEDYEKYFKALNEEGMF